MKWWILGYLICGMVLTAYALWRATRRKQLNLDQDDLLLLVVTGVALSISCPSGCTGCWRSALTIDEMLEQQMSFDEMETVIRQVIAKRALLLERGNQCRAAQRLGVHRNTFNRMIHAKRYVLNPTGYKETVAIVASEAAQ